MYTSKDLNNTGDVLHGGKGELWLFDNTPGDQRFKVYSEDTSLMRQVKSWDGTKLGASYSRADGILVTYDVIIPRRLVRRACKLLSIPLGKDKTSVDRGKRLAQIGAETLRKYREKK